MVRFCVGNVYKYFKLYVSISVMEHLHDCSSSHEKTDRLLLRRRIVLNGESGWLHRVGPNWILAV